jgi:2-polyprenyl-6-methoxyphenol hydroxylase-like FAD-dependent oxidoreductase
MKVLISGGGPAGLACALALKRAHGTWQVTVTERHPRERESGWGLTLPREILTQLDPGLALPFTTVAGPPRFVFADEIVEGPATAPFDTIDRNVVLRALRERCAALGVRLAYETAVAGADDPHLRGHDLVVVAEGAASATRGELAHRLGTTVSSGRNRFVWLATPHVFPRLTVMLRTHAGQPFLAWGYAYAPGRSTFIVECSAITVRAMGLDHLPAPELCGVLARVFASDLNGAPLEGGRTGELQLRAFPLVTNERWWHEDVVLLGDAAHTAHYCTGSGTTDAIRDALALAAALAAGRPLAEALTAYESTRRPTVQAEQCEATRWMTYFEELLVSVQSGAAAAAKQRLRQLVRTGRPPA